MLALAACGGGGGSTPDMPSGSSTLTGTLAYVVSQCHENAAGFFVHQTLMVRQGEHEPVAVMEVPDLGTTMDLLGLCRYIGTRRAEVLLASYGALQHVAVSPDGAAVAFELTDEFSLLGNNLLTAEQRGLFIVRADGTGLRRLGPASRHPSFITGGPYENDFDLVFSPDSRTLTFPDLGPGPDGEEAPQIIALDVATGRRTQITRLPPVGPDTNVLALAPGGLCCPFFVDNQTVGFYTQTNFEGMNPNGEVIAPLARVDGTGGVRLPPSPVALPGSQINPRLFITRPQPTSVWLRVPGEPLNSTGPGSSIYEIFFFDGGQELLQLTNFHRADTHTFGGDARRRVFLLASANPLGTNPSENCQIFSVASLGGDLRQLTNFHETDYSLTPCYGASRLGLGCAISAISRDVDTGTLVFSSSCDPFGTNPNGPQIFALGADGSGLRQLTQLRGLVTEADGTVIAEGVYPYDYSGSNPE